MPTNESKKRRFSGDDAMWRASAIVAVIASVFTLTVSVLLIANYLQIRAITPLDNPELSALRKQLAESPQPDQNLVERIRVLDLLARKAFITSQSHLNMGAWLLLAGALVALFAFRGVARFRSKPPLTPDQPPPPSRWAGQGKARWLVGFACVVWIACAFASARFSHLDIPESPVKTADAGDAAKAADAGNAGKTASDEKAAPAIPDWDAMCKQWPTFRGPGGYGVAHFTNAPTDWDAASGKNVKWKTEIPLAGPNSPVVWDKRVFLTGADEATREVFCFDADAGTLLWRKPITGVPGSPEKLPRVGEETGYAASSVAAHGDRVFAIFANGDFACLDFNGEVKWAKNIGVPDNHYGYSSSLMAFGNLVFVQYDQNKDGKLLAFDVMDGHEAWSVPRKKISWSSPICVKTQFGFELVLNSEQDLDAYDPATGKQIWTLKCLDGEVAPSPAYGGGMFFVANDNATATGVKLDGAADAPTPSSAWQFDELLPDVASPVGSDTHFYIATSRGQIACLDMKTGAAAYEQEFDEGFQASPILVGDKIYAVDQTGVTHIFKTGPTYEQIAAPALGEETRATPAFLDGRIYFRTEKSLICIGN